MLMGKPSFTTIREDMLIGMDARSAENQLPPGYLKDALNTDIVQGRARKRAGYAGYAGNFPVRAVEVEYRTATDEICFTLDSAVEAAIIDLLQVRSSPLVVYGRLSANIGTSGPFSTVDSAKYYTGFHQEIRQTFLTGTNTLTVAGTTHGLGTADLFAEVSESLNPVTLDNRLVDYTNLNIDESTFDINIDYTNGTGSNISVFTYYLDKSPVTGETYVSPITTVANGASTTTSILAATHQLANFNIVARVYRDAGTNRDMVEPDSLTVNPTTGEVQWTVTNNSGSSADYFVILSAAPATNFKQGALSGSTYTITIDNPETPFIFPGVYVTNGAVLEQVIPDEIEYDSVNNIIEVTFQNPGANAFTVYWEYGTIRSTQLCVDDSVPDASGTDERPQITIWGLDHTEIYGSGRSGRQGWANHIDSYRIAGENRIIAGLGGNLYSVREFSESGSDYLYGAALPNLFGRISTGVVLGPSFWETGATPGRTRGYVTGTALGDNWATITNVEFDAVVAGGSVRYDMTIPALALFNSAGTQIATNNTNINAIFTVGDQLTAEQMSYSMHNGVFNIVQVEASGTTVSVWVDNPEVFTGDWDDDGVNGSGGVFTDRIPLQSNSPFLEGDRLLSDAIPSTMILNVVTSNDTTPTEFVASGLVNTLTIQTGVQIVGRRTGSVIPLRDTDDDPTTENFVRGDMVYYSLLPKRPLRVLNVNPLADVTGCTITGDGDFATLTLGSGDTDHLAVGMAVLLTRAGVYSGEQVITSIPDTGSIQFSSTETDTVSTAVLRGFTIQVGEEIEWEDTTSDTNTVVVERRLIPVEHPDDAYALTPSTYTRYYTFSGLGNQSFLRSSMITDNLYLTNAQDPVMKFDGVSQYRAGLPNWQPGVFTQVDTGAANRIVLTSRSFAFTAATTADELAAGKVRVAVAAYDTLPAGTAVVVTQGTTRLNRTVSKWQLEGGVYYLIFTESLSTLAALTAGTVGESNVFRYYYRLNAVDINNNVVASAVAQSEDYSVELTQDAAIRHKLVGFPNWDNYDFDALYVQVYRTRANLPAPFYRVFQQRIPFNGPDGYIEFTDAFRDANLTDLDPTSTLKAGELGVGWQEPLRAKCITTAGNTTVLGNIRDYPQLDLQFVGDSTVNAADFANAILTLRRDYTDTSSVTDMVDTVRYQFRNGSTAATISSLSAVTGTSFTATRVAHGLTAGDWVYVYWNVASSPGSTGRSLRYTGWWQVNATPTANTFTVLYTGADSTDTAVTADAGTTLLRYITAADERDIPVLLGDQSTNPDGNSAAASANTDLQIFQAGRRLALAINSSMRMVDTTLGGMSSFRPWIMARSGNDTGVSGLVTIRQPRVDESTFGLTLTDLVSTDVRVFLNEVERSESDTVAASTTLFPSRILIGYENFAEIFDNPTATLDSQSDSAIDVNPSDGQEVTAVTPFFGESAFGAAQQSGIVVAFKQNSIYLIDIAQKRAGNNPVQRIETEGIGCTAPNSVSVTKGGIFFANEAGMYVLRRNLSVEYLGLRMERQWARVNRDQLELAQGHHYTVGRKYKLSVPVLNDAGEPEDSVQDVFVYDHTNESQQQEGSWTRYDNHPSTGWCNLLQDAYFATSTGRLMVIRRAGDDTDFQDDNAGYTFRTQLRSNDFGIAGIRKVISWFAVNYRTDVSSETQVGTAVDTEQEYTPVTGVRVVTPGTNQSGTGDINGRDVLTAQHTTSRRKGVSFSVQLENSERLQGVEIAGVEYRVGIMGDGQGVIQAEETGG